MTIRVIIMVALMAAIIGFSVITTTEAKSYRAVIKVNFVDSCWDSLYARISDSKANPKTGEHDTLVGKFTVENPDHKIVKVQKSFTFDPKKVPSKLLREYINLEHDEKVFYQDYKHPFTQFDPKRTQYTFTHRVPALC